MKFTRHLASTLGAAVLAAATLGAAPTAHAAGDVAKGEKVFKKCKACHDTTAGKHKTGPSLAGIFGRQAGTAEGFKRYRGLKDADWTWDEATLDDYLADPKKFTKTKTGKNAAMVLKLKKEKDRADVIAYLKTLK